MGRPVFAFACAALSACAAYDPPPELAGTNLEQGMHDTQAGPLRIELSEPVEPESLVVKLYLDRQSTERELCLSGADGLPAGCEEEASLVVGPDDEAISLDEDETQVSVDLTGHLEPFERYVLMLEAGLADRLGNDRGVPLLVPFQAAGACAQAPTSFESGMFFAALTVAQPLPVTLLYYFWTQVDADTARLALWGAKAVLTDEEADPKTNRDLQVWEAHASPPLGYPLRANGQLCGSGDTLALELFPFDIEVQTPPATVLGLVYRGVLGARPVDPGPPGERQSFSGSVFSPGVYLGVGEGRQEVGEGSGSLDFFRLGPGEAPPLTSVLPEGISEDDVAGIWDAPAEP